MRHRTLREPPIRGATLAVRWREHSCDAAQLGGGEGAGKRRRRRRRVAAAAVARGGHRDGLEVEGGPRPGRGGDEALRRRLQRPALHELRPAQHWCYVIISLRCKRASCTAEPLSAAAPRGLLRPLNASLAPATAAQGQSKHFMSVSCVVVTRRCQATSMRCALHTHACLFAVVPAPTKCRNVLWNTPRMQILRAIVASSCTESSNRICVSTVRVRQARQQAAPWSALHQVQQRGGASRLCGNTSKLSVEQGRPRTASFLALAKEGSTPHLF